MTSIHLRGRSSDLLVDLSAGAPVVVHWGAALAGPATSPTTDRSGAGRVAHDDPATDSPRPDDPSPDSPSPDSPAGGAGIDPTAVARALDRPLVLGSADVVAPVSVVPEGGSGFTGRPGLLGHRPGGSAWSPRFTPSSHDVDGDRLTVTADDDVAGLRLTVTFELAEALTVRAELANTGSTDYHLDALTVTLPVPERAAELGSFTGRWTRELHPVRIPWPQGAYTVENRRGRTSHEHPPLVFAGTPGYSEWTGEVWGAHLAWSGNHQLLADRLADGRRYLQLGELLHPGELTLAPGDVYRTPEVVAIHATSGLTAATRQFHRHLRARPGHPTTPRPVLINTWEAMVFDHDLDRLTELAARAARVGCERFVLDDGWFGSRRDDTRGLGDWWVSPEVYPDGLEPLIDHVTGLGMEFGIWVEPEMVNPDSDLFRANPEWALTTDGYEPVQARHQLVLDLTRPDAFDHVLGRLDTLLAGHDISFVKWDMNRDHIAASRADGAAGTHAQTLALYRLLDELAGRHPSVEIESCSSGGARIDHEILRRTVRVWTSDCNDALERQIIQRGASMLIPPEVMGAHIGPGRAATTGRTHDLAFRAATALFGHLGVEWNLLELTDHELDELAEVIAVHKRFRPLLHGGDSVRFDTGPTHVASGVYAHDRSEAVVSFAVVATGLSLTPPPLVLPGLDPGRRYRVEVLPLPGAGAGRTPGRAGPAWLAGGVILSGAELASMGLQPPALHPETAVLLHLTGL
jgi:alpha-galactosidase